ncbi:hypothetical protein [Thermocoleostomius sinensis]|uniref:Uncharacterized protein n=1 Tax=Thermocoleostomius sinensis A174 TaxID=2016057 RepID=A0A9E8ZCV3_9CYAN|nr:hypothetical protein [Thermocoleostomius sinensis]WAL60516.1 hypothetical protein OXH18_00540 [Thermocoleostomius sinensis A174]
MLTLHGLSQENAPAFVSDLVMHPPTVPHLLKVSIAPVPGGVMLTIWEPIERDEMRVKPFLFKLRYRMSSEAEARKFVAEYHALYKAASPTSSRRVPRLIDEPEGDDS